MAFQTVVIRALTVLSLLFAVACTPEAPSPETPAVKPVSSVPELPDPSAPPAVKIVYAQTGTDLAPDGLIKEPKSEVGTSPVFYALGVFQGEAKKASKVKIRILDIQDEIVYEAQKNFIPTGENPILFEIDRASTGLSAGNYRVFFDLDGRPSWELPVNLE